MSNHIKSVLYYPLVVLLGLFSLSFCVHIPSVTDPTTDGRDPGEWEGFPEFTITDALGAYLVFKLSDGTVAEPVTRTFDMWKDKNKLTLTPTSGKVFDHLEPINTDYYSYGDVLGEFYIDPTNKRIPASAAVAYHIYLNGKYIDTGEDKLMNDKVLAPNSASNKISYEQVLAMQPGDVLQVVLDFIALDGVHYKWTSPEITVL